MPSKVREFDETVTVDLDPARSFLAPGLRTLKNRNADRLFGFTQQIFAKEFRAAAERLNLGHMMPHSYQLRHSGPSHDMQQKLRSLLEIKIRGRWRADASLRRYQKEGRLAQQLGLLPLGLRRRAVAAPRLLGAHLRKL